MSEELIVCPYCGSPQDIRLDGDGCYCEQCGELIFVGDPGDGDAFDDDQEDFDEECY